MMKRLNRKQVRELVESVMSEASDYVSLVHAPAISALVEDVTDNWVDMYDEADPSLFAAGRVGWEKQVNEAIKQLEFRIEDAITKVETELFEGEYHAYTDSKSIGEYDDLEEDIPPSI